MAVRLAVLNFHNVAAAASNAEVPAVKRRDEDTRARSRPRFGRSFKDLRHFNSPVVGSYAEK
jgi:hypothetical protein